MLFPVELYHLSQRVILYAPFSQIQIQNPSLPFLIIQIGRQTLVLDLLSSDIGPIVTFMHAERIYIFFIFPSYLFFFKFAELYSLKRFKR